MTAAVIKFPSFKRQLDIDRLVLTPRPVWCQNRPATGLEINRRQDRVSEPDNEARGQRRGRKALTAGFSVRWSPSAHASACLSVYDMETGHERTCRRWNTPAVLY
ncbi:hypothetical protein EYF80_065380 [Liparis tanakae]|uniref:Uncharacterized protein n=1 Tax=Liparis tanakae TaxID=230148 RepID=A0A4Z2E7F7_9TELE|nr:hypothetical protein EYF80_065380 [Liparis tanakae]